MKFCFIIYGLRGCWSDKITDIAGLNFLRIGFIELKSILYI